MDCFPEFDSKTNVVFSIHWTAEATDGTHNASIYNISEVTYKAGNPYTPHNQLTEEQVLGWVWSSGVDQTATQEALDVLIANQITPPVIQPPLPWSA